MAYTPELSTQQSQALRRIAWALGVPMTKAMTRLFETVIDTIDADLVCAGCRDKSICQTCEFKNP